MYNTHHLPQSVSIRFIRPVCLCPYLISTINIYSLWVDLHMYLYGGVPPVIIHFRLGFSMNDTIQRAWGIPMTMETSNLQTKPRLPHQGVGPQAASQALRALAIARKLPRMEKPRRVLLGTSNTNRCGFQLDHIYTLWLFNIAMGNDPFII